MDDVRYEHHLKHRGRANRRVAEAFWIAICATVFAIWLQRTVRWWRRRYRKNDARARWTRMNAWLERKAAFVQGISLIALPFGRVSLGHFIALTAYTSIIITVLLSVNAPTFTFHFTDDVAFRAAWTTISQIPLVYLLSTKRGPLNYLTGLSYERINWLHRCVGRMIFVSATTHMAIMLSSISVSELIRSPEETMRVIRYGVGAYILLLWIAISSILVARKRWYRYFYANHWISTMVFLGFALTHVPSYARVPIYASIALVATDKSLVACRYLWNNMTIRPIQRKFKKFRRGSSQNREVHVLAMGHPIKMVAPIIPGGSTGTAESTTVIRICDLPFKWKPGQHVRMWLPRMGALEIHPFTPATCSGISSLHELGSQNAEEHGLLFTGPSTQVNDMFLMIKAHDGLTKRLADYRDKWRSLPCPNASQPSSSLVAFLDGPYGNAHAWEEYENIIMMSTSTGVSFTLSILHYLEQLSSTNDVRLRTRHIRFVWANRHMEPVLEATTIELLFKHSASLRESGVVVEAEFYFTCSESREESAGPDACDFDPFAHLRRSRRRCLAGKPPLRIRNPNEPDDWISDEGSTHTFQNSSPTTSDRESRSSEETYVEEQSDEQRPCLTELEPPQNEAKSSFWSAIRMLQWKRGVENAREDCQCAVLRRQEQKCNAKQRPQFISRYYGTRPDITAIMSSAVPPTSLAKTMVTVCGAKMDSDVKKVVSRVNIDHAMGRRERGLELHTENMP